MSQYTVEVGGMRSLADALKLLPQELHHDMLPAERVLDLLQTSKTMRNAVQNAKVHAHVKARDGVFFPDGLGLLENLNRLMAGCNVTVLNLQYCQLGDGGARVMLEFLRRNTTLEKLNLLGNEIDDDGARALAEALRSNTTLTSLGLADNILKYDGARALAEALRSNTTLTSLDLGYNILKEDAGSGAAPQQDAHVARA